MYYSYISKSTVTDFQAYKQLFDILQRWFYWAHPNESFDKYILQNPERFTIKYSNCFEEIMDEVSAKNVV